MGRECTYRALHVRLSRARGAASALTCTDCDEPAAEWSYRGGAPDELTETRRGREVPYSLDLAAYDPRCKPCHVRYDAGPRLACGAPGCAVGTSSPHDYCWRHRNGPRRAQGSALGNQIGEPDENGRKWQPPDSRALIVSDMTYKRCNGCGETKPVAGFSTRGREAALRRDPFKHVCLACERERSAARYRRRVHGIA